MRKVLTILSWCLLVTDYGLAQQTPQSYSNRLSVAYSGEMIFHYGINVAYHRSFSDRLSRRIRPFYGLNMTGYRHPKNHISLLIMPEVGYAYKAPSGFSTSLSAQAGYMRRFYDGETFAVDSQGQVSKRPWAGTNALAYGISGSLGWELGQPHRRQTDVFIQPKLLWEYPYNTKSLFHPFINIGFSRYF